LAHIEYEKIQEISRIQKDTKYQKKLHKVQRRKALRILEKYAEEVTKAQRLCDHFQTENIKIDEQNILLEQNIASLRRSTTRLQSIHKKHLHNCNVMSKFVVKLALKKRRIETKISRYDTQLQLHDQQIQLLNQRTDIESSIRTKFEETLQVIAIQVATTSTDTKLQQFVKMAAAGEFLNQDMVSKCRMMNHNNDMCDNEILEAVSGGSSRRTPVQAASVGTESCSGGDDDDSEDEGFLLTLEMADDSDISDVSSVDSNFRQMSHMKQATGGGTTDESRTPPRRVVSDNVSVYTEIIIDDDPNNDNSGTTTTTDWNHQDSQCNEWEEEIVEEVLPEDEESVEFVVVSDEERDSYCEDDDASSSCDSSTYVEHSSIIL
jgi:hypothetical protein